ncbi:HlyD family secretion protein [Pseudomonas sp. B21-040]|jgi:multidrug resistance efflux pump|uniref:HlyD family secretion protein n=1 Tax=unclassified Pseudomonas TaxID=196821 RepID=UPI000D6D3AD7|nr:MULTISPECIES: HlyD family secretion protein [unclassified Pseudomonas]PWK45867.1 multidrug resistance efflux pump [Pseudomonas sp. OV226]UVL43402.1 HlyD family secretion protein [Pseudomonas sp. B21-040]
MSEASQPSPVTAEPVAADPVKKGIKWVLILIILSLVWYLLADRFTPYTQQARVGALVIPVASEVAGRVIRVNVHNNQTVKAGDVLFEVDPAPFKIAVDRARADLETTRRQLGASTAGIASAQATLRTAQANETKARQENQRLEGLYREDPGTISVRVLEMSRTTRDAAISQTAAARAEVERAKETEGGGEDVNAKLRSAATTLSKAELDLSNTQTRARSAGLITDLRTDVGQFASAGGPVMTLITIQDIWITADMTENNLGHVGPDTPVSIVLDSMPGEVYSGHVRSVGYGISVGQPTPPGTLPGIQNSRDWLRPAQRFPVIIEFSQESMSALLGSGGIRAGGQAEVMAFTSEGSLLNPLGRVYLRLMSWLSYAY